MRILVSASIVALLFISAKGGCNKEDEKKAEGLTGKWTWVKSFCCGRNSKWIDPQSCNCTREIVFSEDGKYFKYKDGAMVKEGTFVLRKGINDYQLSTGDTRDAIMFDGEDAAYVVTKGDTLGITMGYMDGPNDYYVKSK